MAKKSNKTPRKVAIACQGGGSHTAFTAGVLMELLTSPEYGKDYTITALTGTSGGALCAGIVWAYLLTKNGKQPDPAQREEAAQVLEAFWKDVSCDSPEDFVKNLWHPGKRGWFDNVDAWGNVTYTTFRRLVPFMESECKVVANMTPLRMRTLLKRRIKPDLLAGKDFTSPVLRIGATNICEGISRPIRAEKYQEEPEQILNLLLASASIPPLFKWAKLKNEYYWDGLYSHNPPIACLTELPDKIPDEIWVIQINPETRPKAPNTPSGLVDRRNELTGNLSLAAELYHVDSINWLLKKMQEKSPAVRKALADEDYRPIDLQVLSLNADLDYTSKLDRSSTLIDWFIQQGKDSAHFLQKRERKWTMDDVEGVHYAAVNVEELARRKQAAANEQDKQPTEHDHTPPKPRFSCSSSLCPSAVLCNTAPWVVPCTERNLDWMETFFEYSR